MHAVGLARGSLRRRLAHPLGRRPVGHALLPSAPRAFARTPVASSGDLIAFLTTHAGAANTATATATTAVEPQLAAAKAVAARMRRKTRKKVVAKHGTAAAASKPSNAPTAPAPAAKSKGKAVASPTKTTTTTSTSTTTTTKVSTKPQKAAAPAVTQQSKEEELLAAVAKGETSSAEVATTTTTTTNKSNKTSSSGTTPTTKPKPTSKPKIKKKPTAAAKTTNANSHAPVPAVPAIKSTPKSLKEAESDAITMTLQEIEALQKTLPSVEQVGALVHKLRRESFAKGQTLFDLYRIYGNPFLDEQFLTPGVLACCAAKKPAQGLQIVRDMLNQGRKVDEDTLRALFDVCEETSAAPEAIELWGLMDRAGVTLTLKEFNRLLHICHEKEYLDGALKVLAELRLHRSISVHTYMHWLNQAARVWRADAFFDLLMEMRLSGVEPEILSLTSLESGRKDRALTVMEGVRAVGLDPCFAMSAVFASMQFSVYGNGPAATAISRTDITSARAKFGELTPVVMDWPVVPIPQVLETQAAGLILQQETFRRLKMHQVQRIDELLQMLPITTNMTINLRKQLQRMSLLVNTHRVRREARDISAQYNSGKTLIELSSLHNYPPVSLMRIILRERGLNTVAVKRALASPSTHLSKRDQYELRKASGYDSIHRSDPFIGLAEYNADSLETTIEHFLRARGIRFKTEDELGQEQSVKYGRRVISPDILLLDPVIVNGTPIRWIDAKNYYGAHIVSKRLISRQLESYVKEWGPGAIVFGMGYSDMFSVPGVICLDTTPFPKTTKEKIKMRSASMAQSLLQFFSWKKHLGSELTQEYPMHVERGTRAIRSSKDSDNDEDEEDEDVNKESAASKQAKHDKDERETPART